MLVRNRNEFDIVVIGGGILGIAHAYFCLQMGLKVALIEKNAYPRDATVRNFGQIVPSGFGSKWQEYGLASLEVYREIQKQADVTLRQHGSVYVASDAEEMALLEELSQINGKNGYASEMLTKAQVLSRYQGLQESYAQGALYFPLEMTIDPRVGIGRIIDFLVSEKGLTFLPRKVVREVVRVNEKVILTTSENENFSCQKVFICNGIEFEHLFPERFKNSDLRLVQLQMMDTMPQSKQFIHGSVLTGYTIRRYEAFQECPSWTEIKAREDASDYQHSNGVHILFKQLLDGSVVLGDSHRYQKIADGFRMDYHVDFELNKYILSEAQKIYDLEDWSIRNVWMGIYCECETREIFDESIDEHIHITTGIGGKGMTGSLGYAQENIKNKLSINQATI